MPARGHMPGLRVLSGCELQVSGVVNIRFYDLIQTHSMIQRLEATSFQ